MTNKLVEYDALSQRSIMTAINDERQRRGMSLASMEEKSGVSANSFYAWLNCKRSPSLVNIVALAQTFGFIIILRKDPPNDAPAS